MNQKIDKILKHYNLEHRYRKIAAGSEVMAGVYVRQSTSDRQNYHSVDEQLELIRHRAKTGQIKLKKYPDCQIVIPDEFIYVDRGATGRIQSNRESYLAFQNAIQQKRFQAALVFDLSRLSREMGNLMGIYDLAKISNVELFSVSEMISSCADDSQNHYLFKGMINQMQVEAISNQTRRGLEIRALNGLSTGHFPYGYKSVRENPERPRLPHEPANSKITIDEEKAQIVRRIFEHYADGKMGIDTIARLLNQDGIPSASGSPWQGRSIYNILKQLKYIGVWVYGKSRTVRDSRRDKLVQTLQDPEKWIVQEHEDRRIITQELWDRVQQRLQDIQDQKLKSKSTAESIWGKSRGQARHLFTGTMACGHCGGKFIIVSGKESGYLGCKNALRSKTCTNKRNVRHPDVEASLIGLLKNFIDNPKSLKYLAEKYNQRIQQKLTFIPSKIAQKEKDLQKVEKAIQSFLEFLAAGNQSEAVADGLRRSEEQKKLIIAELRNLKSQQPHKVLLTPFAIKEKLVNLDELLKQNIPKANAYLKGVFPAPIRMLCREKPGDFQYEAVGEANLSKLIRYATPVNGAPKVLDEVPVMKGFRVKIKKFN